MIESGFIESEIEGLSWEYEIQKILENTLK